MGWPTEKHVDPITHSQPAFSRDGAASHARLRAHAHARERLAHAWRDSGTDLEKLIF
jgi:hypothetical protein